MNEKTQAIAVSLGGTLALFSMMLGGINFNWVGLIYVGFCIVVGFSNWIRIDKELSQTSEKENEVEE